MRRMIMPFGRFGDVTVTWEEENNDLILPAIQAMLDAGVVFFVLAADGSKQQPTAIDQVAAMRTISVPNEELQALYEAGTIRTETTDESIETTGEIARTADAVADNDTVAVAPAKGG